MDIKTHTAKHDSFARLPRAQREPASERNARLNEENHARGL